MTAQFPRTVSRLAAVLALVSALVLAGLTSPASAADQGSIDHVQTKAGSVDVLFSVPGTGGPGDVDLSSVEVTVGGRPVRASASVASEAPEAVRRTAILAIDTSNSMRGERFAAAKRAAELYLATVPDDVYVGIVSFAGDVRLAQEPSQDRSASLAVLDALTLTRQTRLYDGVQASVRAAGTEGQRSVLVLSDGRDTSGTPLKDVAAAIADAGVKVDVVSLQQRGGARAPLEAMAAAGDGAVLDAADAQELSQAFAEEANALVRQILVTAAVPDALPSTAAEVAVSIDAAGSTYSDSAYVTVREAAPEPLEPTVTPAPPPEPRFLVSERAMLGGVAAVGLGGLLFLLGAFGVLGRKRKKLTVEDRVGAFSRAQTAAGPAGPVTQPAAGAPGLTGQAVGMAQKALSGNRGLEVSIGDRLEGAGLSLKPAEWLLLHAGLAIGAGLLGLLLSSGGLLLTILFLVLGAVLPWVYLGFKRSQRLKKFNSQLADTLQLMAGSLSAGLSLAQSLNTVEREGNEPIAGEFRRALIETRLGVSIEDALDSLAERMDSKDFRWVVMAIRIQRSVGGNLAELLLTVAATLREREYLRRHVSALSAEGRLSCWILGGLPPLFLAFLMFTKPDYVQPMFSTPVGFLMLGAIGILLGVGIFWMSRVVKVEV